MTINRRKDLISAVVTIGNKEERIFRETFLFHNMLSVILLVAAEYRRNQDLKNWYVCHGFQNCQKELCSFKSYEFTVNHPLDLALVAAMNADGVFTDEPQLIMDYNAEKTGEMLAQQIEPMGKCN